ncbi:hypothetical protein C8R48DRAFT_677664 [Suillus tomentosus]|nr:hypothetical protein C8R48DRAFT_677664 [Suillus tomentosus]
MTLSRYNWVKRCGMKGYRKIFSGSHKVPIPDDINQFVMMDMRSSLERSGILYGFRLFGTYILGCIGLRHHTKDIKVAILLLILSTVSPKRIVVDIIVSNRVWLFWTLIVTCSQGGYQVKPVISNSVVADVTVKCQLH